ncbi:MAG: hypothetical protein ACREQE_06185 [Candidatus Binataceae bacterium]
MRKADEVHGRWVHAPALCPNWFATHRLACGEHQARVSVPG